MNIFICLEQIFSIIFSNFNLFLKENQIKLIIFISLIRLGLLSLILVRLLSFVLIITISLVLNIMLFFLIIILIIKFRYFRFRLYCDSLLFKMYIVIHFHFVYRDIYMYFYLFFKSHYSFINIKNCGKTFIIFYKLFLIYSIDVQGTIDQSEQQFVF